MGYRSSKTFGHELGLSCAFRQWRADHSHCSKLHRYAISVHFESESEELDARNWVMDFGGFKGVKQMLQDTFDHKVVIASDDPHKEFFRQGHLLGVMDVVEIPAVGCEKFAEYCYYIANTVLRQEMGDRVKIKEVTVREHGANSATYTGKEA